MRVASSDFTKLVLYFLIHVYQETVTQIPHVHVQMVHLAVIRTKGEAEVVGAKTDVLMVHSIVAKICTTLRSFYRTHSQLTGLQLEQ